MKLEIINTMIVKEGKAVIKIKLQFAFIKISITLKTLQTNMHLAIRNYNEMGFTELYLINESNNKLINQTDKYCDIILNLEKDFNSLLVNKHDFSNIFKESFNEMYEQIKNFTTIIFQEFIQIIRNAYDNYTEVLEDVNENKHEVFNEIRKIIKYEYINFIYSMLVLVEEFNNKTFIFLFEVSEEVSIEAGRETELLKRVKHRAEMLLQSESTVETSIVNKADSDAFLDHNPTDVGIELPVSTEVSGKANSVFEQPSLFSGVTMQPPKSLSGVAELLEQHNYQVIDKSQEMEVIWVITEKSAENELLQLLGEEYTVIWNKRGIISTENEPYFSIRSRDYGKRKK
jgi:hypothetical protein